MAGLDDLFAEIPVQDIASKIGAPEGEVNNAIHTLVPALAYIGKQLTKRHAPAGTQAQAAPGGGGLGDILGSILGGAGGGNNPLGSILGSILGGNQGGALGDILGGLLGGKK
jgi:hypothetical protein